MKQENNTSQGYQCDKSVKNLMSQDKHWKTGWDQQIKWIDSNLWKNNKEEDNPLWKKNKNKRVKLGEDLLGNNIVIQKKQKKELFNNSTVSKIKT